MKKFYLDVKNGIVCGVCAGLSNYFNVDVLLIRILCLFFINITLTPYILIALIREPKEETDDKLNDNEDEQST